MSEQGPRAWIVWVPPGAPAHVSGMYEEREWDEFGQPEPQKVTAACDKCGAAWQTTCASGSVRSHIARFAAVHAHRDPFRAIPKK